MDTIWEKYVSNILCAELLLKSKQGFSEPSAHFVYYGIYHLIQYIICHNLNMSYLEQKDYCKGANSHKKILDLFYTDLKKKFNQNSIDIWKTLERVKRKRNQSDYSSVLLSQQSLEDNFNDAITLIKNIKPLYGLTA